MKGEVCGCCCVLFGGLRCCEGHTVNIMGAARQEWDDAYRGEVERHEPTDLFFFSRLDVTRQVITDTSGGLG